MLLLTALRLSDHRTVQACVRLSYSTQTIYPFLGRRWCITCSALSDAVVEIAKPSHHTHPNILRHSAAWVMLNPRPMKSKIGKEDWPSRTQPGYFVLKFSILPGIGRQSQASSVIFASQNDVIISIWLLCFGRLILIVGSRVRQQEPSKSTHFVLLAEFAL